MPCQRLSWLFTELRAWARALTRALPALLACAIAGAEEQLPMRMTAELESVRVIQDNGMSRREPNDYGRAFIDSSREGIELQGEMYPPGLFLLVRAEAPDPWLVGLVADLQVSARLDNGETLRYAPTPGGLLVRAMPDRFGSRVAARYPIGIPLGVSMRPARRMASVQASFHAYVVDGAQVREIRLRVDGGQRWRVRGLGVPTGGDDLVIANISDHELACDCSTHGLLRLRSLTLHDAGGQEIMPNSISQHGGADTLTCTLGCNRRIAEARLVVAELVRVGAVTATFIDAPCAGALDRGASLREAAWRELPLPPELANAVTAVQATPHAAEAQPATAP
jgi:hypothetical protein